ncbi:MAG: CaiB/BaiF CoA transferase family protein [Hyphomonadaceae bacterium]
MTSLLSGCRVIESSMLLNGASTTMMLADLGADIIKVESPFLGDYLRIEETMHMHRQTNKNKRSIALDLRKPEGQEIFARLMKTADVFVTNAIADRNRKLGLAYDQLTALKPDIVYCQNTGFGATGPYAEMPTHGQMMDSLAGAMPMELGEDGFTHPKAAYVRRTGSLASAGEGTAAGAIYAAFHIAAALAHRAKTGRGAYIDVSSAEAVIASAWIAACNQLNKPERAGFWQNEDNILPIARYQAYETKDHFFVLFCPEEKKFWHAFCDLVERPDLKDEANGIDLRRELQTIFRTRARDEWVALALKHNFPLGPIHDGVAAVRADPHIAARGVFIEGTDETGAPFTYIGQPALIAGVARVAPTPPPGLGEHTSVILRELGYGDSDIQRFEAAQVTRAPERDPDHISNRVYGDP